MADWQERQKLIESEEAKTQDLLDKDFISTVKDLPKKNTKKQKPKTKPKTNKQKKGEWCLGK